MTTTASDVTVIIPTRDRVGLLRQALRALDAQTMRDFDVVVVDDGSSTDLGAELVDVSVVGRPVRVLRRDGSGAVRARIAGIEATDSPYLAFTDSDCEPQPEWLASAMRHLRGGVDLVAGRTIPMRPLGPLERSIVQSEPFLYPSCNLAVRRTTYEAVGGFDVDAAERLGFRWGTRARGLGFGEDTIFGWAVARDHEVVWDDEMLVLHRVFPPDRREWFSRSLQMGAFPMLIKEVPEIRPWLVRPGGQVSRRTRLGFYATVAATATRRPAVVATAFAGWSAHRFYRTLLHAPIPVAERVKGLPMQLALDAVQGTAMLLGSAQSRTFLH